MSGSEDFASAARGSGGSASAAPGSEGSATAARGSGTERPGAPSCGAALTRVHRRVSRPGVEGTDPHPNDGELAAEDRVESWGEVEGPGDTRRSGAGSDAERDEMLRREKPPHWG